MPEQHIQDLQQLTAILPTDLLNVQRHDGDWKNYRVNHGSIYGIPLTHFSDTFDISDLDPGIEITILPSPGAGNTHFITRGWVKYTPGTSPADEVILVSLNTFDGANKMYSIIRTAPGGSVVPIGWSGTGGDPILSHSIRLSAADMATLTNPPSGDGTITIEFDYAVVAL